MEKEVHKQGQHLQVHLRGEPHHQPSTSSPPAAENSKQVFTKGGF